MCNGIPKPYYSDEASQITLYEADALQLLPSFAERTVALVFTDPPYFLSSDGITCKSGKMASVNKGSWDRIENVTAMHAFNKEWMAECQRLLNQDGAIWVCGTMHNIYSIGFGLQQLGFKILNDIIWEKAAPPPNLSCRYFTHATEHLIWAAKSAKSKHVFNYQEMRAEAGGKQMKSIWRLPSVLKAEKKYGKHPTQKPEALVRRAIRASTKEGDLVLDPFCGSGTTAVVCKQEKRRFIGIEKEKEFLDLSIRRLLEKE